MSQVVQCHLMDGPLKGDRFALDLFSCRDVLFFEGRGWFRALPNGDVGLVMGPRPSGGDWVAFVRYQYRKTAPVTGGRVEYLYVETTEVDRCETIAGTTGKQCRNEAEPGDSRCRTHGR